MRIFQLNTFCGVKSTGRIAGEIARLVQMDGGECRIGYGVPGISAESEPFAYRIGTPVERKIHGALRKLFDAEGYGSYWGTKQLVNELERFQPDLIHLHNLHGCYLHLRTLFQYLKTAGVPVVWTLHDCWPFTGHCAYFDYAQCERWTNECHHCPQQKSYPVCVGFDGSKRNHALKQSLFSEIPNLTFVAPCEWMKQPLSKSFLRNYPVRVIYNGVNRSDFTPTQSTLRERYHLQGKNVCLAVASEWDERKGLRYICDAARKMGDSYHFVVIGLLPEQIQNMPENVLGFEHTADMVELAAWYTLADCFVNPTLEDNMPMVNLEALACGTPVAVFKTGGCPEAIDQSCGCVVEQGNLETLCKAITHLCEQKSIMRDSCIQRAGLFDSCSTFQKYMDLYKELCK